MQANTLLIAALLLAAPASKALAEELPDTDLLEFLGGYEIEVDGEIVNPVTLDIEDTSEETVPMTTRQTS
jgi:hypothetical protein